MKWEYLVGDVREVLATLPEKSVHTIVTSPPYWGLRDYGIPPSIWGGDPECEHEWGDDNPLPTKLGMDGNQDPKNERAHDSKKTAGNTCQCGTWRGCLGLEPTPEMFIEHMVEVCRGLWRVLRDDGTFWLNLGDCYASSPNGWSAERTKAAGKDNRTFRDKPNSTAESGLKPKDLVMMPHRVAFALQEDGWWVRSTIVWSKPNPMPESCTDRPTSAHEYIFLLTKKARYFFDVDAVREPAGEFHAGGKNNALDHPKTPDPKKKQDALGKNTYTGFNARYAANPVMGRNLRNVWQIATQPYPEAHFATFPEKIPETCIKAGTSERGCCPQCGAPWSRVVEKEPNPSKYAADYEEGLVKASGPQKTGNPQSSKSLHRGDEGGVYYHGKTTGFQPTCECVEEWKRRCGADSKGEYHGKATKDYEGTGAENPSEVKARILEGMVPKITTGFRPTCDCPPELEPIPCTVMDPFAGSGTTIKVARHLGRSALGIDISEDYQELATERAMLNVPDIESFV